MWLKQFVMMHGFVTNPAGDAFGFQGSANRPMLSAKNFGINGEDIAIEGAGTTIRAANELHPALSSDLTRLPIHAKIGLKTKRLTNASA